MDAAVTKAYQSLLLLTVRQPDNPEYLSFAEEVKERAKHYDYTFDANASTSNLYQAPNINIIG